ncbi:hypothetical protein C790_02507 [Morganella morganii SC01]|nr:hypothetical protein C790_02507 [Morganella morganii SC01]
MPETITFALIYFLIYLKLNTLISAKYNELHVLRVFNR